MHSRCYMSVMFNAFRELFWDDLLFCALTTQQSWLLLHAVYFYNQSCHITQKTHLSLSQLCLSRVSDKPDKATSSHFLCSLWSQWTVAPPWDVYKDSDLLKCFWWKSSSLSCELYFQWVLLHRFLNKSERRNIPLTSCFSSSSWLV